MAKLSEVAWADLKVGQTVWVESSTDRMGGDIVRLDSAPMIWIRWHDGNRYEYNQAVLSHVDVTDDKNRVQTNFDASLSDRLIGDPEGE